MDKKTKPVYALYIVLLLTSISFAQTKSAIQFYDSTGGTKTGKIGWFGDAPRGYFFLSTPTDGELMKTRAGGLEISGSVHAGRFVGDGSSLTGMPSPTITSQMVVGLVDSLNSKANASTVSALQLQVNRKADTAWVSQKINGIDTVQLKNNSVTTDKIVDKAVTDSKIDSVNWQKVSNKPSGYVPERHSHELSEVSGLVSSMGSKVDSAYVNGVIGGCEYGLGNMESIPLPPDGSDVIVKNITMSIPSDGFVIINGSAEIRASGGAGSEAAVYWDLCLDNTGMSIAHDMPVYGSYSKWAHATAFNVTAGTRNFNLIFRSASETVISIVDPTVTAIFVKKKL